MNPGEYLAALLGEPWPHLRVGLVAKDAASEGLPLQPLHDDEGRVERRAVIAVGDDLGLRDAGAPGRLDRERLDGHPFARRPGRVAAQN